MFIMPGGIDIPFLKTIVSKLNVYFWITRKHYRWEKEVGEHLDGKKLNKNSALLNIFQNKSQ